MPRSIESETFAAAHVCHSNFQGSALKMEAVGATRIFERSIVKRGLKYAHYFGDGDSKGFISVKDTYGKDSVTKYESIGHVQKRVGARLRKLKSKNKNLSGILDVKDAPRTERVFVENVDKIKKKSKLTRAVVPTRRRNMSAARATIDLLKDTFGDRLISRFGPVNWPPRSCDLTPLDYFLWGYVKSLVYVDKPQMLDHLEDNVRRVIANIQPQMLEKVIESWTSRLDYIRASCGSHMPEIIFTIDLELEVNDDDIEELIMGHEDELTTE
ncbi:transposable element Tc3 transposase [Trichonephila clavipes]|nr:transposable element Tc3 transposase [Trichonephila clavipes]